MPFEWSQRAPLIQSLFRPWHEGDGYSEAELATAEASLGFRLPEILRRYYATWGRRNDMNQVHDNLADPENCIVLSDGLVFCFENQGAYYWAIPLKLLHEQDPPVSFAAVRRTVNGKPSVDRWEQTHPHLSVFLDELTCKHALCGGALHGGVSQPVALDVELTAQFEQYWQKVAITPMFYALMPDVDFEVPPLYIRNSSAFYWWDEYYVATGSMQDLETIATEFRITWEQQW